MLNVLRSKFYRTSYNLYRDIVKAYQQQTATNASNGENSGQNPQTNQTQQQGQNDEGALKADIASVLYDRIDSKAGPHLFLGLTGVNNISQLSDALRYCADRGTRKIGIFIDMDYRSKKEVADALNRILEIISSIRCPDGVPLQYQIMEWDEKYKGIDDYLLSVYKKTDSQP